MANEYERVRGELDAVSREKEEVRQTSVGGVDGDDGGDRGVEGGARAGSRRESGGLTREKTP